MGAREATEAENAWKPYADPPGMFSSGIPGLDQRLGGGLRTGSFLLVDVDESVLTADLRRFLFPTILNFLAQSRGMVAVLPARESPHEFRRAMLGPVSRRLFDSRVRIVDYVGEDDSAPYVTSLAPIGKNRKAAMRKMVDAEKAASGARGRPFIELVAFEVFETLVGAETAGKMYFHGIKRARAVGNLCIGILRPGLACASGVRSMMDYELSLQRDTTGLRMTGLVPSFPTHLVLTDRQRGAPHVELVPPG